MKSVQNHGGLFEILYRWMTGAYYLLEKLSMSSLFLAHEYAAFPNKPLEGVRVVGVGI
jgi:hypothetical protein